jgi:hypothetical protein
MVLHFFSFPSFLFFSFFPGFVSFATISQLILNYTYTRDRNSTNWNDVKTKRDRNHSPSKNKLVQDSEGNEENGYPDPESNKTNIKYTQ